MQIERQARFRPLSSPFSTGGVMRKVLAAIAAFVALAAFTATAEAETTGSRSNGDPTAAMTTRSVVDPGTGNKVTVTVVNKKFETKKAAISSTPSTASRDVLKRTGWGWTWHVVRCAGGAWGGFWASWFLPPWVRVGSVVAGCVVSW